MVTSTAFETDQYHNPNHDNLYSNRALLTGMCCGFKLRTFWPAEPSRVIIRTTRRASTRLNGPRPAPAGVNSKTGLLLSLKEFSCQYDEYGMFAFRQVRCLLWDCCDGIGR